MHGRKFFEKLKIGQDFYQVQVSNTISPSYTIRKLVFLGLYRTKQGHFYITHSQGVTRIDTYLCEYFDKLVAAKYYIKNEHRSFYLKKVETLALQLETAKKELYRDLYDSDFNLLDATDYKAEDIQYFKDYPDMEKLK